MTLKCPTCKTPVDPFPDACSAVMCLNCGNHYCNYCFQGFATGQADKDRASAHEHTAIHHDSDRPGGRDAFLSTDLVLRGHQEYRSAQLVKCLSIAMTSTEFGIRSRHDVALALILCSKEIEDLNLNIHELWSEAEARCWASHSQSSMLITAPAANEKSLTITTSEFDDLGDDFQADSAQEAALTWASFATNTGRQRKSSSEGSSSRRRGGLQLANAILTNNHHALMQLIESYRGDLDVDYMDIRHGHPLCTLAILSGQVWAAKILLERGADPLRTNKGGRTVLYIAVEAGLEDIIRFIFEKHPHVNINDPATDELQRYCPIHVAARNNHGTMIRTLVELGSNLDLEESEHGYTPLMLALVLGYEWVATELILAGANVRYLASNGRSPMFVAAEKGLLSIINLMISHCGVGVNEPAVRPSGLRMIHVASFHKQPVVVSQLIGLGANVNQFDDENGYSPLSMAILGLNSAAALDLIAAGADALMPSRSGRTPLYVAIEKGLTEVVKALAGIPEVDINAPVTTERNAARPLHVAILYGQSHLIPLLISLGADVNLPDDERKCSPLLMATLLKDAWSVKLLLRAKADPCQLSREGRSALYIAAEKGFSGILRLLIEDSSDVDINGPVTSEFHRGTALHIAAMFDNAHTVIELLSLGADVNTLDATGRKAITVAKEMSSVRAEAVLSQYQSFPAASASRRFKVDENSSKYSRVIAESVEELEDEPTAESSHSPTTSIKTAEYEAPMTRRRSGTKEVSLATSTPLPRRNLNDNSPKHGEKMTSTSSKEKAEASRTSPSKASPSRYPRRQSGNKKASKTDTGT
jgi:ankyrin repeat protein